MKIKKSGKVYSRPLVSDMLSMMSAQTETNNLSEFKKFIESEETNLLEHTNAIQYK